MKIAKFEKWSFSYEEEHLDIHDLPEITHDDAKALLFKVNDLLEAKGVNVYLAFGTLLGAVRDKDFIKGDLDVDVYVKGERCIFENLQYLEDNGVKLIRYKKKSIFSFRDKSLPGCYIDVYVLSPILNIWGLYCWQLEMKYMPKKYFKEDDEILFLDKRFRCVKHPERLLEFWYEETWNVPVGKFDKTYKYEVASHYYYRMIRTKVSLKVKKILGKKISNYIIKIIRHD